MKRLFIVDLLWIGLVILCGWTWSLHDQSEYADRLNHYGISDSALTAKSTSQQSLKQTVAKLNQRKLAGLQIQFQTKDKTIYFWGSGSYAKLPIQTGQWYSQADLKSDLPILVVGQKKAENAYRGSNQRYLLFHDHYVPILGVVGTRAGSALNDAVFVNASASVAAPLHLSQLKIIADGNNLSTQSRELKQILQVKHLHKYTYQNKGQNPWWEESGMTLLRVLGLLAGAVILAALAAYLQPMQTSGFGMETQLASRYLQGLWTRCLSHGLIASVIGALASNWLFYLNNRLRMLVFTGILLVVYAVLTRTFLHLRGRRQEKKLETLN